jgi:Tol biopolymer transport system component
MNADGSGQTRITNNPANDFEPAWSPDGSKIAFWRDNGGSYGYDIYVMNADGSSQTRLTTGGNNYEPSWSTDGKKIVFTSGRDLYYDEIYVMNADGTGQTRLTFNTIVDVEPAWSPDGSKIVFVSDRDGTPWRIYVMNSDGTGQTRLTTPSWGSDLHPAWSPDGSKIVFESVPSGNSEIYIMNPDGTGQTRLTTNPENDMEPAWGIVPKPGNLDVKSSPSYAKIYINGVYSGHFTKYTFNGMAPGMYNVYVTLDGYATPATQNVKVISGQTVGLNFKLQKIR